MHVLALPVPVDGAVRKPDEHIAARVVSESRLQLDRSRGRLRPDTGRPERHDVRLKEPVEIEEGEPVQERVAVRRFDAARIRFHDAGWQRCQALLRSDEHLFRGVVLEDQNDMAARSCATAIVYVFPFAGGCSDVNSICLTASAFVRMWPVE